MAHKGFQLGLEMPALLSGIATKLVELDILTTNYILKNYSLEMPALLSGIATC